MTGWCSFSQALRFLGLHPRVLCVSGRQAQADRPPRGDEKGVTTELLEPGSGSPLALTALGTQ
eukprot:2443066-Amphidinium_carterae.1